MLPPGSRHPIPPPPGLPLSCPLTLPLGPTPDAPSTPHLSPYTDRPGISCHRTGLPVLHDAPRPQLPHHLRRLLFHHLHYHHHPPSSGHPTLAGVMGRLLLPSWGRYRYHHLPPQLPTDCRSLHPSLCYGRHACRGPRPPHSSVALKFTTVCRSTFHR